MPHSAYDAGNDTHVPVSRDTPEGDYVLGTDDDEMSRLGLQHQVWRPRALDAWQRAGVTIGDTVVDVGCGPGYAAIDLAEMVGERGHVIAIDRSPRFLQALKQVCVMRGVHNIEAYERDLDSSELVLPTTSADAVWCRWVLSFVTQPRQLLERMVHMLRPGGAIVIHEYFDYRTWRLAPRNLLVEEFVGTVMQSWRAHGGEPDIALSIPQWLGELELNVRSLRTIVDVVPPHNFVARWPSAFLEINLRRLIELKLLTPEKAAAIGDAFREATAAPHSLMITPAVLEIIAVKK